MKHALTIDLEEFHQIHALADLIPHDSWDRYPSQVEDAAGLILDHLAQHQIRATFFCLGWVAERHPDLIRQIHSQGHEIACHGYAHRVIFSQDRSSFRDDVTRAKQILEDITGARVHGYRAPTYSITTATLWALDILKETGFTYDSSIFPIVHDTYGIPDAPRFPHRMEGHDLVEFPPSTARVGPINLPVSGGGYFRLLPYPLTRGALKSIERSGMPFIFYIHPWELSRTPPRIAGMKPLARFRTYVGLAGAGAKFQSLLSDFAFTTAYQTLIDLGLLDHEGDPG